MTDKNSITPPRELVEQWQDESPETQIADHIQYLANRAAQWGYDQANHDIERKLQEARDEEFRACRRWLYSKGKIGGNLSDEICIARRNDRYWTKTPSLKEQALTQLDEILKNPQSPLRSDTDIIRRALEQLPDD